jgi:hypothetical protein
LTHRIADHQDEPPAAMPVCRLTGSPFRPRPASPSSLSALRRTIAVKKPAPYYFSAIHSVLPSNSQTFEAGLRDDWGRDPDISKCGEPDEKPGGGGDVQFWHGIRNLFETNYIDSMNMNRPCSRLKRYAAGMCFVRKSNGLEKISLQDRRGGMTTFIACGSPGGE